MKTIIYLIVMSTFFLFGKKCIAQTPQLIISEIMYNPPEDGADSLEFIEIYNNENTNIDLSGIQFSQGISFTFPNITLAANEYVVIAKDSIVFQNTFGMMAYQWNSGSLSNTGEILELQDQNGNIIDMVDFQNALPWPSAANGLGASLVLCDFQTDNNIAENWIAATTPTNIFINNQEIIANPNAESLCPNGPIVSFLGSSISVIENNIEIDLKVVMEKGNANLTSVLFSFQSNSTAVLDEDFTLNNSLPIEVSFPPNLEKDTQIITIQIIDDFDIEANEIIFFNLSNPTNEATIDPMHDSFEITIEDNDATLPKLIISEIMYNPPENGTDSTEFIELYNNDTISVNLINYTFSEGVNFTFPELILNPSEYIVIASDSIAFANYYGFIPLQWTSGSLINTGEIIELRNPGGSVADVVEYDNTSDWSLAADGNGASLVLCDYDGDNNNASNWDASISATGNIIEGKTLFADPGMENNCFVPLSIYPIRDIGIMTTTDGEGVLDSLNRKCELQGIVHGVNLNLSNDGLQFVLIDENNNGITVYSNSENYDYEVLEGDEVMVQGTITQFNGLAEIIPDTVILISQNNTLTNSQEVFTLGESTESQLIQIKNLSIINLDDWNTTDPTGFNVAVTNGVDTFDMRIDRDVDLYGMSAPDYNFHLTGLGGQFDQSAPYTESYQILPRYFEDLEMTTSIENFKKEDNLKLFPNPTDDFVIIENNKWYENLLVTNVFGQVVFSKNKLHIKENINLKVWQSGFYIFTFYNNEKAIVFKIFKKD